MENRSASYVLEAWDPRTRVHVLFLWSEVISELTASIQKLPSSLSLAKFKATNSSGILAIKVVESFDHERGSSFALVDLRSCASTSDGRVFFINFGCIHLVLRRMIYFKNFYFPAPSVRVGWKPLFLSSPKATSMLGFSEISCSKLL